MIRPPRSSSVYALALCVVFARTASAQTPSFGAATLYDTNSDTTGLAVADLNHDGHLDLVVATCDNGTVRVRLGDGTGAFGDPTDFDAGALPVGVVIADFNGDTHLDIATANEDGDDVSILLGDGTGQFGTAAHFTVGAGPDSLVSADFNGDHKLDLAVANTFTDDVTILLGDGAGGFAEADGSPIAVGVVPFGIQAGDLNGDLNIDLVVVTLLDDSISVLVGDGMGAFSEAPGSPIVGPFNPFDVALVDLNQDTILDLVVSAAGADELDVLLGNGDATFTPLPGVSTGSFPEHLAVTDFNGDGLPDVAVTENGDDTVSVFVGDGAGNLLGPNTFSSDGLGPEPLAAGDFNEDGKIDLAVGHIFTLDSGVLLNDTCCFVRVVRAGTGEGFISSNPPRILCGTDCYRAFDNGSSVVFDAIPAAGSVLGAWSGGGCTTGPSCTFTPTGDMTITATFDLVVSTLTPGTLPAGAVGAPFTQDLTIGGNGLGPYTLNAVGLPPGLEFGMNGSDPLTWTLFGVPLRGGVFSFTIDVTDLETLGLTHIPYTLTIAPAATTTTTVPATAAFSNSAQSIPLLASVNHPLVVDEGTVTFTVRNASNVVVGSPVTSATVAGGSASAPYTLPANTPAQPLTITAVFNGSASFLTSTGTAALTVNAAVTTTDAANATTGFNAASQNVPLSATVTSATATVDAGTVTFVVRDASNVVIGAPTTSAPLTRGVANLTYAIPAGITPQVLTITATYNGSANFAASVGAARTLTIGAAQTTTAGADAAVTFSANAQPVALSAAVTSAGGTVNGGSVTFDVRNASSAVVGVPVSASVINGTATAVYTVPAATPPQPLTIFASYSGTTNFAASADTSLLDVGCRVIAIEPAIVPPLRLGEPMSRTFTVPSVGDATLALTGALPPGLTFTNNTVSGTPTALGRFDITITATSASSGGCSSSTSYPLSVIRVPNIATGSGTGAPNVRTFNGHTALVLDFLAEPSFVGGVRVAAGDVNGDGAAEIITAPGPGAASATIRVFNPSNGALMRQFVAYPFNPAGGVYVAAGDVNADGYADIVTGRDGAEPEVKVFDGATGQVIGDFLAYAPDRATGVRVAVGDVNGDGYGEIITSPNAGADPEVRVFTPRGSLLTSFLAYAATFRGGVYVASGDLDGDGAADIITGTGFGGAPQVNAFSGRDQHVLRSFFAYAPEFAGGVRVAASDLNNDGQAEIITGAGPGGGPHVRVWDGATGSEALGFFAYDPSFAGGVFVAAPTSLSRMAVDLPVQGSTVSGQFPVAGWALQSGATADSGVDRIDVWAYAEIGGAPIYLGSPVLGFLRPDVANLFGGTFANSGFGMFTGPLPPGVYNIVVYVRNARTGVFRDVRVVGITVR